MNKIKKIIEEHLKNARNDYEQAWAGTTIYDILQGQIEAYQDCLNLIPTPRTEQEILKDFELLGYEVVCNTNYIRFTNYDKGIEIRIKFDTKTYCKFDRDLCGFPYEDITMQEHKLLNELFEVWGWL
jgi:hypothetical protein